LAQAQHGPSFARAMGSSLCSKRQPPSAGVHVKQGGNLYAKETEGQSLSGSTKTAKDDPPQNVAKTDVQPPTIDRADSVIITDWVPVVAAEESMIERLKRSRAPPAANQKCPDAPVAKVEPPSVAKTSRIPPLAKPRPAVERPRRLDKSELDAMAAGAKDKRGTAAKMRLAQRAQTSQDAVDDRVGHLVRIHNEANRMAVEKGNVPDLPYLEDLVNQMRNSRPLLHLKGARHQSKMLNELIKDTEVRNKSALTNIIAKVAGCTKVHRKADPGWLILSGFNRTEASEYILYKSKEKNSLGDAVHYNTVLVLYHKSLEVSGKTDTMCVMQRAEYLEAKLLYLCLECLLNFELASQLLERVQQRELENKVDMVDSKHSELVDSLMDLEADLNAFAEMQGGNEAVRKGDSITSFNLLGPISDRPAKLIPELLDITDSLQTLLRTIGQSAKG